MQWWWTSRLYETLVHLRDKWLVVTHLDVFSFFFISLKVPCLWLEGNRFIYPPWVIFILYHLWCSVLMGNLVVFPLCVILLFLFLLFTLLLFFIYFLFYFYFYFFYVNLFIFYILFLFKGGHFLIWWKPNLNFYFLFWPF